ncbi:putative disease resistance protein At3g14460 [Lingula anatina]|uniref:Disease resistance protein At3g14460 n=1 Tax=Lingula anatina TaxID=7574 RepID=A0A1S3HYQ1_LINAN|nr:putative disease resistance protein At3g14460 [Lingula anatina]|eukprot:XP_013391150.1 putative disease resistance protein At3g14460 [Lingula anatina]
MPTGYVARDDPEKKVLEILEREKSVGIVSSQGIHGPGGVGKTYLAQAVAWKMRGKMEVVFVEVGTNPNMLSIMNSSFYPYLENGTKGNFTELEDVWIWLSKITKKKKVLIVLDDVWSEKTTIQILWQMREALSDGSQLLYTTRTKDLLLKVKATPYELGVVPEAERWDFFVNCAALNLEDEQVKANTEQIGKAIIENTDGLPIILDNYAQHLKQGTEGVSFQDLLNQIKDEVTGSEQWLERSFHALKPSTNFIDCDVLSLPKSNDLNRVQQLFLCLGVFKDDERFRSSVLETIYKLSDEINASEEDIKKIVHEDLNILANHSLIKFIHEQNGDLTYTMHDIVREYALKKGEQTFRYKESGRCFGHRL